MIEVIKYDSSFFAQWNDFVKVSKNATFLLNRDFMDYHQKKFIDFSLIIFDQNEIIGLLPANVVDKTIYSHSGLSFGGLIVSKEIKLKTYLLAFKAMLTFLKKNGIDILKYKSIPIFYTNIPSQEEEYVFFLLEAVNYRTDSSITIRRSCKIPFQRRRMRSIKKGRKNNFSIKANNDFKSFWEEVLVPNLNDRFGKNPVHSLEEILLLHSRFPKNIHQINIYKQDIILAGCTVFETGQVAHAQYISANSFGRKSGALDLLFDYLITDLFRKKEYFDFGICNENDGNFINHGLLDWKEGFGGRTFVNKFYEIETLKHVLIEKVTNLK